MTLNMSDLKQELKLYGTTGNYSVWYPSTISGDRTIATSELGIRFPSPVWDFRPLPTKIDIVDWLANYKWLGEGSPFDLLPDEVVLKILKMASWYPTHLGKLDTCMLVLMSRVSVRFNRIAHDKSLNGIGCHCTAFQCRTC